MWDNVQFLFVFVGKVDTFLIPWLFIQKKMQLTKTIIQRSAEAPQGWFYTAASFLMRVIIKNPLKSDKILTICNKKK